MINSSPGRISQPSWSGLVLSEETGQSTRRNEQRRTWMRRVPCGDHADLQWMRSRLLLFQRTPEVALEAAQIELQTLQNLQ